LGTVATRVAQAYIARNLAQQQATMYIGLGKSSSWNDENNVPASDYNATALDEPIAYTKAQKVFLCKPVLDPKEGNLIVGGVSYKTVSLDADIDPSACYLYATTDFSYADLQKEIQFRQVGLFVNFIPKANVTSIIVTPAQVDKLGTMLSIQNSKLVNITKTSKVTVGAMYSVLPILN
jgi:hypothetical protein